jgi:hypothetical protein
MVVKNCPRCNTEFSRAGCRSDWNWERKVWCSSGCRSSGLKKPKQYSSGKNHYNWKGGVQFANGYKWLLKPEHPDSNKRGYIAEHRLILSEKIGRRLLPTEDAHHIDFNKLNNSLDNLHLFENRAEHTSFHQRLNSLVRKHTGGLFTQWPSL